MANSSYKLLPRGNRLEADEGGAYKALTHHPPFRAFNARSPSKFLTFSNWSCPSRLQLEIESLLISATCVLFPMARA